LIGRKGLPDRGIIVNVLRHHIQHLRKTGQRDKRRIESLFLCCVGERRSFEVRILLQPVIHIDNFLWIGRCGCDLSQQRIGVKRNRSQQLIQLLCSGRGCLGCDKENRILGNHHGHQQKQCRKTRFLPH